VRLPDTWNLQPGTPRIQQRSNQGRRVNLGPPGETQHPPAKELAAEFKIGLTSLKRLIREHGMRRKDQRTDAAG
jgi:hypothetical protein